MRIAKIKQNFNVVTEFVHFPLHPDTPVEGRSLEALFGAGPDEIQKKNAHMKGLMQAEQLPYGERTHTYNSRLSQELAKWAVTQPGGEAIHDAMFITYFVDTQNVASIDVLLSVIESIGLDTEKARDVLENRTWKDAIDADWQKSHQYGVTGVPTYVTAGTGVVGAQSYEVLEQLVREAGAQPLS